MAPGAVSTISGSVDFRDRPRGKVETPAEAEATVFLGNIGRGFTQGRMRAFLQEHYGNVRHVRIVFDRKTQHHRGFGFAMFHDADTAKRFIRDYGPTGLHLDGNRIKVGMRDRVLSSSSGSGTGSGSGSESDRRPQSGSGSASGSDSDPPVLCDSDNGDASNERSRPQRCLPQAVPAPPMPVVIPQVLPVAQGIPTVLPVSAAASHAVQAVAAPSVVTHGVTAGYPRLVSHATAVPMAVAAHPQVTRAGGELLPATGVSAVAPSLHMNGGLVSTIPVVCVPPAHW